MVLELAQLYLLQGQLDLCEQRCSPLLQIEETQERASMVGESMLIKSGLLPNCLTSDASLAHPKRFRRL